MSPANSTFNINFEKATNMENSSKKPAQFSFSPMVDQSKNTNLASNNKFDFNNITQDFTANKFNFVTTGDIEKKSGFNFTFDASTSTSGNMIKKDNHFQAARTTPFVFGQSNSQSKFEFNNFSTKGDSIQQGNLLESPQLNLTKDFGVGDAKSSAVLFNFKKPQPIIINNESKGLKQESNLFANITSNVASTNLAKSANANTQISLNNNQNMKTENSGVSNSIQTNNKVTNFTFTPSKLDTLNTNNNQGDLVSQQTNNNQNKLEFSSETNVEASINKAAAAAELTTEQPSKQIINNQIENKQISDTSQFSFGSSTQQTTSASFFFKPFEITNSKQPEQDKTLIKPSNDFINWNKLENILPMKESVESKNSEFREKNDQIKLKSENTSSGSNKNISELKSTSNKLNQFSFGSICSATKPELYEDSVVVQPVLVNKIKNTEFCKEKDDVLKQAFNNGKN